MTCEYKCTRTNAPYKLPYVHAGHFINEFSHTIFSTLYSAYEVHRELARRQQLQRKHRTRIASS